MGSNSKMDSKFKNGQLTLVGPIFGEVQNCTHPPLLLFWARGNCPKANPSRYRTTHRHSLCVKTATGHAGTYHRSEENEDVRRTRKGQDRNHSFFFGGIYIYI